jgi:L-rhamnose mutarotase
MDLYLLQEHWATLVRKFKDVEHHGAERMTNDMLDYVRYASIRQYKLFQQKRGEEFERMFLYLEKRDHDVEMVKRFIENDDHWETLLELAEQ